MACFLVLMQNGQGIIDKHPDYILEKTYLLKIGYEAFGALDIFNMRKIFEWAEKWHVNLPDIVREEMQIQNGGMNIA